MINCRILAVLLVVTAFLRLASGDVIEAQEFGITDPGAPHGGTGADRALPTGGAPALSAQPTFQPQQIATLKGYTWVEVVNGFAYTADAYGYFHIIDVRDPYHLIPVARIANFVPYALAHTSEDTKAYFATEHTVYVVDTSVPWSPVVSQQIESGETKVNVAITVADGWLYVVREEGTSIPRIFTLTAVSPEGVGLTTEIGRYTRCDSILAAGGILALSCFGGTDYHTFLYHLDDPAHPEIYATVPTAREGPACAPMLLHPPYLYVHDLAAFETLVYPLDQPGTPDPVQTIPTQDGNRKFTALSLWDGHLFRLQDNDEGTSDLVDIREPENATPIPGTHSFSPNGYCADRLETYGELLFMPSPDGLGIWRWQSHFVRNIPLVQRAP